MVAKLPEALETIETSDASQQLPSIIKNHHIDAIVAGLPRDMQGRETAQTEWVRNWLTNLRQMVSVPIYWQDEALTTVAVQQQIELLGIKDADVDAQAACLILDDFLRLPDDKREEYRL